MTTPSNASRRGFPSHYVPEDRDIVNEIKSQLQALDESNNELSRVSGVPAGTISQVLSGKYPSKPGVVLSKLQDGLLRLQERQNEAGKIPFVETSVYNTVRAVCEEALMMRATDSIGLFCGHVGVGKTTSAKEYCRRNPNALYLRASVGMSKTEVLIRLMELLKINYLSTSTISSKQAQIMRVLRGKEKLILLDEATRCSATVLECLRDIADETETALVFAGREQLADWFAANEGRFAEISSRVLMRIPPIKRLTRNDIEAITKSVFPKINEECMQMVWECSQANGRELQKLLIKLNNFKKNKGSFTPKNISDIYHKVIAAKSPNWRTYQ